MNTQGVSSPPRPDLGLLATTLQTKLPFEAQLEDVIPLAGDASNRRYFRLTLRGGPIPSLILMQLADPEGFKSSEEAVSSSAQGGTELPFINVLRPMAKVGVPVPTLHFFDESAGLLYLEDFGDVTLFQACADRNLDSLQRHYTQAIDTLVQIHLRLSPEQNSSCVAFSRSFDVP
ncbi:MAG: phosphotransferase, partial [Nitrospirota bacterium]|nr:phosphotransferase [Nitrospirota bacterium]